MKKMIALSVLATLLLTGCGECKHQTMVEADCTTPKHCADCDYTEGEPLGHDWQAADCEHPKTCARCDETEGESKGHKWFGPTHEKPKTCTTCGATEGEPKGHKWFGPGCTYAAECGCGAKDESRPALGHTTTNGICESCEEYIVDTLFVPSHDQLRDSFIAFDRLSNDTKYNWKVRKTDIKDAYSFGAEVEIPAEYALQGGEWDHVYLHFYGSPELSLIQQIYLPYKLNGATKSQNQDLYYCISNKIREVYGYPKVEKDTYRTWQVEDGKYEINLFLEDDAVIFIAEPTI